MTTNSIPDYIDTFRFASETHVIEGEIKVADLARLAATVYKKTGTVLASLHFGVDEQGIRYLNGHVKATLILQCQRCLDPVNYEIMSDFVLGIVTTLEEASALPERYEATLAKERHLALKEVIEDEIFLNLPIIPRHEQAVCKVKLPVTDPHWEGGTRKNPFHVLAALKDK